MNQRMLAGAAVLLMLASTGCGTAGRCDDGTGCGEAAPSETDCLEALAAHKAVDGCGVFVAYPPLFNASDDLDGTMARPVYALAHGIELARAGRRRMFVCNQLSYPEILTVPSGIDVHGGFNCDRGWQYEGDASPTVMGYPAQQLPHTIVPDEGERHGLDDGISTFTDVKFHQSGTSIAGQSAIGILVEPNAAVELVRSHLIVAGGASGLPGNGFRTEARERARDGADGNPGGDACSADTVAGGAAVTTVCEDGSMSTGGKGGDGHADRGEAGSDGTPLPSPNPDGAGLGGAGGREGSACGYGKSGQPGELGADGRSGRGPGRITREGWVGESGTDGKQGGPGRGGGGGGGSFGGSAACGASPSGGASGGSGGSGGAGGCGGQGGRGGGYGGASIGILALDGARVTLRQVAIETGDGGSGGKGDYGQDGGVGGRWGGIGQHPGDYRRACDGGSGGYGGPGGNGGGGTGGPSIGIAYVDEDQFTLEDVTFTLGAPGKGGATYKPDDDKGDDGFAAETYRFTP
ncbi:hypothetical protein WMF28_32420 [Sorangium sp. So ce590]|uniref:hypothetical protein n=1 Tax=Sorangium sp. So ce590 TaxID=3133317 RepID=UPI003F61C54D